MKSYKNSQVYCSLSNNFNVKKIFGQKVFMPSLFLVAIGLMLVSSYAQATGKAQTPNYLNATYHYNEGGQQHQIPLKNGKVNIDDSNNPVAKCTSTACSKYYILRKTPVKKFTDNGKTNTAVIIILDSGGSGTFANLAVAFGSPDVSDKSTKPAEGSNLAFIGDRVNVKDISEKAGIITVTYTLRKVDDPKQKKHSKQFKLADGKLSEIGGKGSGTNSESNTKEHSAPSK